MVMCWVLCILKIKLYILIIQEKSEIFTFVFKMLADFCSVYSVYILGPSVYHVRRILVLPTNCQWAMTFTTIFILKFCSNSFSSRTKWMPKSGNVIFRHLGF